MPSLDQRIYHWDGNTLIKLPYTIEDLTEQRWFLSNRRSIWADPIAYDVVGINIHTGKVRNVHFPSLTPHLYIVFVVAYVRVRVWS